MAQYDVQQAGAVRPSREVRITALGLLKSYYDEEVFGLLVKEFYDPDPVISEAAIRASGSLGNEVAISHLYQIIEKGRPAQRIAAVRALAAIRAPSSTVMLVKYFSHFGDEDLRVEILRALNTIAPSAQQVQELNGAVYADPRQPEAVKRVAVEGIVDSERFVLLKDTLAKAAAGVQQAAFARMLQTGSPEVPAFANGSLSPEALGSWLAVRILKSKDSQANVALEVLDALQKADRGAVVSFLLALSGFEGRLRVPRRLFQVLLAVPWVDDASEALVGDFLKKMLLEVKRSSPALLSEFSEKVANQLDHLFAKVSKNFISLKGITRKEELLVPVFAGIVERYASVQVLDDLRAFFRGDPSGSRTPPLGQLHALLSGAPEKDRNRLAACAPLFALQEKKDTLPVSTALSRVDLSRWFNIRRINRLIRVAGALEIRTTSKRIQEILDFSRAERIHFLEETSVVTLCQLLTRSIIEQARDFFRDPRKSVLSLNGYIRGARFIPAKYMASQLVQVVLSPPAPPASRELAVASLAAMELGGMARTLAALFHLFDLAAVPDELKMEVADLLGRHGDAAIGQQALDLTGHAQAAGRRAAARILRALAPRGTGPSVENVTNRLYQLLEDAERAVKVEALLTLLAISDDYAVQVAGDYVRDGAVDVVLQLVAGLPRPLTRESFRLVLDALRMDRPPVQEALRGILPELTQGPFAEELRIALMEALSRAPGNGSAAAAAPTAAPPPVESVLQQSKLEFKFRRDSGQRLTVFFADIANSTMKSTVLKPSQMMALIRAFENIVGGAVEANRGHVVKKLGDGLLATFKHPLHATAAALSAQRKIADYSAMKVDEEKFQARVGLNTGTVYLKDGDIFGEVVNVAARMQSIAQEGDVILTEATWQEIRDYARCVALGPITVKGIKDPVTTYKTVEITVDLSSVGGAPAAVTPGAKRDATLEKLREAMFVPSFSVPAGTSSQELAGLLRGIFTTITQAVEAIGADEHEEYKFKEYLQESWNTLMGRL